MIEYRGYTIKEDYRNPYSSRPEFMFFPTEEGEQHDADYNGESYKYTGNCQWTDSLHWAKVEIDCIIAEKTDYLIQNANSGTITKFQFIEDAKRFCEKLGIDFGTSLKMKVDGFDRQFDSI